ncbi:MAG TPA: UDP-N-acetylmuramoyl-L-alanine--D-glutamate ligase [Candidatus Paceibacterota bacterium]
MFNYKTYFSNKKITMMGLGLLGRGVAVAKFLASCGAVLTVTDLKIRKELAPSLLQLKKYKNIRYVLGRHELKDFSNCHLVIKAAGVPLDSPYVKEAIKNKVPVEMEASLFAKLSEAKIIGITGTRGKTTTAHVIYEILKKAGKKVFIGGNIRGGSTLPFISKFKGDCLVVLELDSWQLQGFGDSKISPNLAVFTTFYPDHLNYYKGSMKRYFDDKANILKYQKKGDFLITQKETLPLIKRFYKNKIRSKVLVVSYQNLPKTWNIKIPGQHNLNNIACAVKVAQILGLKNHVIKKAVEEFSGVPGRLEYLRDINGVKIYNDNNSTTPDATIAGLRALGSGKIKKIILIMGGTDKGLDMSNLCKEINKYCKTVVLLKESGTEKIKDQVNKLKDINVWEASGLKKSVELAMSQAARGDTVIFSPAFASFGKFFKNEYDRNDQFIRIIKKIT